MSYNANGLLNRNGSVTQYGNTKASGGGGGVGTVINLTTSRSALFNQTVTLTGTYDTYTATFDSTGHATVNVFYVDTYAVTCQGSTDSVTVSAIGLVINADVFSATTVNITTSDSDLIGETISVYFGSDPTDVRASLTFDSNLSVSFQTEDIGTYNIVIGYSNPVSFTVSTVGGSVSVIYNPTPTGSSITPVNNVRNWLDSAKVFDKNYTTISQVLSDATTLQTLISSNNANDYLVRSTSWVSDVCGNSTAMSYIGLNNYSANTLLANSTWCTAICNSTYFESVLNVKIPTMTSNTTPRGKVLRWGETNSSILPTVSIEERDVYHAFDGIDNDIYNIGNATRSGTDTSGIGIGYDFGSGKSVDIRYMYLVSRRDENMSDWTDFHTADFDVQVSNDGTHWTTLKSFTSWTASGLPTKDYFILDHATTTKYRYVRVWSIYANYAGTDHHWNSWYIYDSNFYGRQDV